MSLILWVLGVRKVCDRPSARKRWPPSL